MHFFLDQCVVSLVSSVPAVGLNQFSDMTFAEFKKSFLLSKPQVMSFLLEDVCLFPESACIYFFCWPPQNCSATKGNYAQSNLPRPDSIDWRKKGNYVTPVKNQVSLTVQNRLCVRLNSLSPHNG